MKFRLVLLALALLAPAFAGCIGGGGDEPLKGTKTDNTTGNGGDPNGGTYPPPTVRTPLTTGLTASASWVKPGDEVVLEAVAPADAKGEVTYEWSFGPLPDPATGGGHEHGAEAEADPHAGHGDAGGESSAEMLDTGEIAGGSYSDPMQITDEGVYLFHCHPHPFMKLTVTVKQGGAAGVQHVAILDGEDAASYRFAPDEITIAPGARIVFWNNGTMMHTATQESFEPLTKPIEGASGPSITWKPATDGDYRVVVTVKDGETGVGKAEVRVLVDSMKPDALREFDPMTGSYNGAAGGQSVPGENKHAFILDYTATTLTVKFKTTGTVPDPFPAGTVKVSLVSPADGKEIAASEVASSGEFVAENVPSGQYSIVVTADTGLAYSYEVLVSALYDLVPPAPGEAGDGHGHAH